MQYPNIYIDGITSAADGTLWTPALLIEAIKGGTNQYVTCTQHALTTDQMTIAASRITKPDAIRVANGNVFQVGNASRCMKLNHATTAFYGLEIQPLAAKKSMTVAGFFETSIPDEGASSQLWDLWKWEDNVNGDNVVMQLDSGRGGTGDLDLNIETTIGGSPNHSAYVSIASNTQYWCCLNCNFATGIARLNIYNGTTFALIAALVQTQAGPAQSVGDIALLTIGQDEEGIGAYNSYYEHMMVFNSGVFPVVPVGFGVKLNQSIRPRPFAPGHGR